MQIPLAIVLRRVAAVAVSLTATTSQLSLYVEHNTALGGTDRSTMRCQLVRNSASLALLEMLGCRKVVHRDMLYNVDFRHEKSVVVIISGAEERSQTTMMILAGSNCDRVMSPTSPHEGVQSSVCISLL